MISSPPRCLSPVPRAHPALFGLAVALALAPRSVGADDKRNNDEALRWLVERVTGLTNDPRLAPARVGVEVLDPATGKLLVRIRADEMFNVASNVKLVTAAAALSQLGPEFRMKTVLYATATKGQLVQGDLYLKGFGDPSLTERDLWLMADRLYERGIRRVQGGLVLDESYFDAERLAPLFGDKRTDLWFRPPCGPLSLNSNQVAVRVLSADQAGEPARVLVRPSSSYLRLVNKTLTVGAGRRSWVKIQTRAEASATVVEVSGRVRLGYQGQSFRRRIEDPGLLTGMTLLDVLQRRGIKLGRPQVSRGQLPPRARPLVAHYSQPLAVVLRAVSKHSNNFVAEQIVKVMGAEVHGEPGTWAKGLRSIQSYLAALKIMPGQYVMKNGSGLYDATRFSPSQLVRVMREAAFNFKFGHEFLAALPLSGVDGTLGHRFLGTGAERYVRAKTGSLANVVALTGVAGASGRRGFLLFSVCINELPAGKLELGRQIADEVAAALVSYLER